MFFSRFPIVVWFVIIAIITSASVSYYTYYNVFYNQTEEIKKSELSRINQRMIQLQGTVNDFYRRHDYNAIHREVSRLSSDPTMGLIAITDEHGEIKYSSLIEHRNVTVKDIPEIYEAIEKRGEKNSLSQIEITNHESTIIGLYPLDYILHKTNDSFHSYLFARFNLAHTLKVLHYRQQQELIQTTLIHFTLLLGGFLLLYLSMKNRIASIINGIRHFSDGDYDSRIKLTGIDEFSKISNGFDAMAIKLQSQNRNLIDLTEQLKKQHQELAYQEKDLRITLNSIGDAVITTDAKGNITRMNPVAEQLTHWSLKDASGLPLKKIFPIIDATTREPIENPVEKVLATGETVYLSNHTTLIAKDGTEYQISDSAAPIRDGDGNILGMVLIFNDVSETYQLRSNVNKQLARFKELSNLALTLTGSPQDSFDKICELIVQLLEVKVVCLSEIRGDELYFLSVYADGQIYRNSGHCDLSITPCSTVKSDKDIRIYQHVAELFPEAAFLKDNEAFSYCGFPAMDSSGKVLAVTCLLDDKPHEFTEEDQDLLRIFGQRIGLELEHEQIQRKLTKKDEQLRLSQKMDALGKLTGGVAHDYNNMLGVIIGYAELLKNALSEQPKLFKYAHEVIHAGERSSKLTKKLLAFSRQKTPESDRVDINVLLKNQQHMLEKTLTVRIKLAFDLANDLWPVWLDASDTEDAILNMCINAMHAIEDNGQLTIRTSNEHFSEVDAQSLSLAAGDYVALSITDTGSGMDEVTKEKIFDPFYSTKGDKGTGLGLSQVYSFVGRSNGEIKVYTELDHGTQFTLYFPRYNKNRRVDPSTQDIQPSEFGGDESILIVDDESALLGLTCEILQQRGYNTHSAEGGKQALRILENESIDLLISDIVMPEMDGFQLISIVQEKYPTVKIQLASGFVDDRHADTVDDSLRNNLLLKPFNSRTLLQRVRVLLDEKT